MSEERFRRNCYLWLLKAYSVATKPREFKAIARMAELLGIEEL